MKLIWQRKALQDREDIMSYIARDNPVAAIELDLEFEEKAEFARQHPKMYKLGRLEGTREIVAHPNYVMVHRIDTVERSVVMLRVLPTARQWP